VRWDKSKNKTKTGRRIIRQKRRTEKDQPETSQRTRQRRKEDKPQTNQNETEQEHKPNHRNLPIARPTIGESERHRCGCLRTRLLLSPCGETDASMDDPAKPAALRRRMTRDLIGACTRSSVAAPPVTRGGHGRGGGLLAQRARPPCGHMRGRVAAAPDVHRETYVERRQPPSGADDDVHVLEHPSGPRTISGGRRGTHDKTTHQQSSEPPLSRTQT